MDLSIKVEYAPLTSDWYLSQIYQSESFSLKVLKHRVLLLCGPTSNTWAFQSSLPRSWDCRRMPQHPGIGLLGVRKWTWMTIAPSDTGLLKTVWANELFWILQTEQISPDPNQQIDSNCLIEEHRAESFVELLLIDLLLTHAPLSFLTDLLQVTQETTISMTNLCCFSFPNFRISQHAAKFILKTIRPGPQQFVKNYRHLRKVGGGEGGLP